MNTDPALVADDLVLGYDRSPVVREVSLRLHPGAVTALIGPNGSGKSTVLRALARLHRIGSGRVRLATADQDLEDIGPLSARAFATRVTLLSQSRPQPSGLLVRDVVAFGRHPHRRRFSSLGEQDQAAIDRALAITGMDSLAARPVDQLSGGELQRVWLAACLAQDTAVVLLDEPTNHLDLRHQVETLELIRDLAERHDAALGVVLHDLNHAAAVADDVVLLAQGQVCAAGHPEDVLTSDVLSQVYGLPIGATVDPETGQIRIEAAGARRRTARPLTPHR